MALIWGMSGGSEERKIMVPYALSQYVFGFYYERLLSRISW